MPWEDGSIALAFDTYGHKIDKTNYGLFCTHAAYSGDYSATKTGQCWDGLYYVGILGTADDTLETLLARYGDATFYYILANPVETPLTEDELNAFNEIRTNSTVTTMLNDVDAGMRIKYNIDTKTYIDGKFEELLSVMTVNFENETF